jgi:phosphoglycerate kinase
MVNRFHLKSIKPIGKKLSGQTVLVRVDFNVPVSKGKVADNFKIFSSLETIRFLKRYRSKIILISHAGDPVKNEKQYSLLPMSNELSRILGNKIKFLKGVINEKTVTEIISSKKNEIVMLDNLRFNPGEKANDPKFAKLLSSMADVYINDAFSVSHRRHASVAAITRYLPSYAGVLLEKEVLNLNKLINPNLPLVLIVGGAKIKTKLPLINNFLNNASQILVGGGIANSFLSARGWEVGCSLIDDESVRLATKIKSPKILLPIDFIVKTKNGYRLKDARDIKKNDIIGDIGPETIALFSLFIYKAKTLIWNGPMGIIENKNFNQGTKAIARSFGFCSRGKAYGVAGGGETLEGLKMADVMDLPDWVSTGGGAMLAYLGGERMPGLEGITK